MVNIQLHVRNINRYRPIRTIAIAALASLVVGSAGVQARAADGPGVEKVAPELVANAAKLSLGSGTNGAVEFDGSRLRVVIPKDPTEPITLSEGTTAVVSFKIPYGASSDAVGVTDGRVSFRNKRGFTTIPVVKVDGSVAVATSIASKASPSRYAYDVNLPKGATLHTDEFGGAFALASDGRTVLTTVQPAWAKDRLGRSVATYYEVDGNRLVQVVKHRDERVAYPVIADPWWGNQWKISSTSANRLASLVNYGAGISGIVAAICGGSVVGIPCGVAYGVAAGLLAIGSSAISYCNSKGRGININLTWNSVLWCTSR